MIDAWHVLAMQEEVLRLILLTLSEGALIARKTLVMYIVQTLAEDYRQVSKTCVGHVVQLLYRASCFNVIFEFFSAARNSSICFAFGSLESIVGLEEYVICL